MTKTQCPLIGITSYGRNTNGDFTIPVQYIDSIRRAGGIPLTIPPGEHHLKPIIDRLDGIILAGGGDLDPSSYNGNGHSTNYNMDAERDKMELEMGQVILNAKIPTFAICRGIQIINTILGGTLFEHIPDHFGERVFHRLPPRLVSNHNVVIENDSVLYNILQKEEIEVVSWHHQSINKLGTGLRVTSRSSDGVIEGVEFENESWFIGVQWHPELSADTDPNQQALFDAFINLSEKT